jgi:catecholate siderophore receptor
MELRNVPQSVTVIDRALIRDQGMQSMADVVRYIPGITMGQGEGNRDQPTIRGNGTTSGFFTDGMRDDAQYFRDLYSVERVEGLKGSNALIFGRGSGGGVLNRVTKEAGWAPVRQLTLQGGSHGNRRGSIDVGQGVSTRVAGRLNAMYENSDIFRRGVSIERYGVNPTATIRAGASVRVTAGYELFTDLRTADRGVPSFTGAPLQSDITTFFGDPGISHSDALVHSGVIGVDYEAGPGLTVRNRTRYSNYDKFYQNVFPGAVNPAGTEVSISAYNNRNDRTNLFNQTELVWRGETGPLRHTLLGGVELGRQVSDNFRNTGFFNDATTSVTAPVSNPTISVPVTFRQSATDADNHVTNGTASVYAQDQLELGARWQVVLGVRFEQFHTSYLNNRNGQALARTDNMVSPRAGLIFKPEDAISVYGSYSTGFLPGSGDQFSSLTVTSAALEPEKFVNYEAGAKWDVHERLALTTAIFQLDRRNTIAPDPTDPALVVQTGSQRTRGFELGVAGSIASWWQVTGGYTNQSAIITSPTTAAAAGQQVALVPRHTVSLWNRYDLSSQWGAALGLVYQDRMFAAIDNTVTLPDFTRVDAALFFALNRHLRAQLNVENVLDARYYGTAHSNNNISPGAPRAARLVVTTGF